MTAEEKIKFEQAQKQLNEEKEVFASSWFYDGFLDPARKKPVKFLDSAPLPWRCR